MTAPPPGSGVAFRSAVQPQSLPVTGRREHRPGGQFLHLADWWGDVSPNRVAAPRHPGPGPAQPPGPAHRVRRASGRARGRRRGPGGPAAGDPDRRRRRGQDAPGRAGRRRPGRAVAGRRLVGRAGGGHRGRRRRRGRRLDHRGAGGARPWPAGVGAGGPGGRPHPGLPGQLRARAGGGGRGRGRPAAGLPGGDGAGNQPRATRPAGGGRLAGAAPGRRRRHGSVRGTGGRGPPGVRPGRRRRGGGGGHVRPPRRHPARPRAGRRLAQDPHPPADRGRPRRPVRAARPGPAGRRPPPADPGRLDRLEPRPAPGDRPGRLPPASHLPRRVRPGGGPFGGRRRDRRPRRRARRPGAAGRQVPGRGHRARSGGPLPAAGDDPAVRRRPAGRRRRGRGHPGPPPGPCPGLRRGGRARVAAGPGRLAHPAGAGAGESPNGPGVGAGRARPEPGRRLAAALPWLWHLHGQGPEGIDFLRRALRRAPQDRSRLQARLLTGIALVADTANPFGLEYDAAQRALEIASEQGDEPLRALCLTLSAVGRFFTDFDGAWRLSVEGLDAAEAAGDAFVVDAARALQGIILHLRDRHEAAEPLLASAVEGLLRRHRGIAATTLGFQASGALSTGRLDQARRLAEEAVVVAEPLGDYHRVGSTRSVLALVLAHAGQADAGLEVMRPVLRLVEGAENDVFVPGMARTMGTLELWRGQPEAAARWFEREARSTDGGAATWIAAQAMPGLAAALRAAGHLDRARAALERAVGVARGLGMPRGRSPRPWSSRPTWPPTTTPTAPSTSTTRPWPSGSSTACAPSTSTAWTPWPPSTPAPSRRQRPSGCWPPATRPARPWPIRGTPPGGWPTTPASSASGPRWGRGPSPRRGPRAPA